jgi:hypothetical protein
MLDRGEDARYFFIALKQVAAYRYWDPSLGQNETIAVELVNVKAEALRRSESSRGAARD